MSSALGTKRLNNHQSLPKSASQIPLVTILAPEFNPASFRAYLDLPQPNVLLALMISLTRLIVLKVVFGLEEVKLQLQIGELLVSD